MSRYSVLVICALVLSVPVFGLAVEPGSCSMPIWNPASYEWDYSSLLERIDDAVNLGYDLDPYNGQTLAEGWGPIAWANLDSRLLSPGVFVITGLHGHGHPGGMLVGIYTDPDDRDEDLRTLNDGPIAGDFYALNTYFYGIVVSASRISSEFSNNSTFCFDDGCKGLTFINTAFSAATSRAGWTNDVVLDTANSET